MLKSQIEWHCTCGAVIAGSGSKKYIVAMLTNFVNLHPCVIKEKGEDDEEGKQGSSSQVEHAGFRAVDSDTLGAETPIVLAGFQPNKEENK